MVLSPAISSPLTSTASTPTTIASTPTFAQDATECSGNTPLTLFSVNSNGVPISATCVPDTSSHAKNAGGCTAAHPFTPIPSQERLSSGSTYYKCLPF